MKEICIYFIVMSFIAFFTSAYDKYSAIKNKQRISEKSLFFLAFVGGSVGLYLSMYVFRHKTKHKSFTIGIPLIILLQCLIGSYIYMKF